MEAIMCNLPENPEDDVYKKYNAFKPFTNPLKKHPCPECFNCLFCSETRCQVCRNRRNLQPETQSSDSDKNASEKDPSETD